MVLAATARLQRLHILVTFAYDIQLQTSRYASLRPSFLRVMTSNRVGSSNRAPAEYKRMTEGAERLSLNLRFRRGGKDLDNKARLDLDCVVNFITDLKFTGQNILLFGFADDGIGNEVNLELSKERAQLVAEQFKRRGLTPFVVTGFGDSIPVASSLTEEGKEKNRRVELWLKK